MGSTHCQLPFLHYCHFRKYFSAERHGLIPALLSIVFHNACGENWRASWLAALQGILKMKSLCFWHWSGNFMASCRLQNLIFCNAGQEATENFVSVEFLDLSRNNFNHSSLADGSRNKSVTEIRKLLNVQVHNPHPWICRLHKYFFKIVFAYLWQPGHLSLAQWN